MGDVSHTGEIKAIPLSSSPFGTRRYLPPRSVTVFEVGREPVMYSLPTSCQCRWCQFGEPE